MKPSNTLFAALLAVCVFAGAAWGQFAVERDGKHYHRMNCELLRELDIADLLFARTYRAAAIHGREPCPVCKPPVAEMDRRSVIQPFPYLLADLRSRRYHRPACARAQNIPDDARRALSSYDEAVRLRLRPCDECRPPSLEDLRERQEQGLEQHTQEGPTPEARLRAERVRSEIVTVPANEARVRTGIEVKKGQVVLIQAKGGIQIRRLARPGNPPPVFGPGGAVVGGKLRFCLMARIGRKVHEIGRSRGIRVEQDGMLYLGVLDDPDGYETNEGAFQAWVRVFQPVEVLEGEGEGRGGEE